MAKKKAAKKKAAPRIAAKGDNSDFQKNQDEKLKVAKAWAKLEDQKAEIRAEEKKLKKRLSEIGVTLQQFKPGFDLFMEIRAAKNDAEVTRVIENHALFMAAVKETVEALSPGQTLDWIDMVQSADEIRGEREEEEREAREAEEAAAAEAAEGGDDATTTESVH